MDCCHVLFCTPIGSHINISGMDVGNKVMQKPKFLTKAEIFLIFGIPILKLLWFLMVIHHVQDWRSDLTVEYAYCTCELQLKALFQLYRPISYILFFF